MADERYLKAGVFLGLSVLGGAAWAATSVGNLSVSATVANSCSISTETLDFSFLNVGAATNEATPGEVTVTCTAAQTGTSVTVDGGQNASAGQRRMVSSSTDFIAYDIFSDAGHSSPIAIGGTVYSGNIAAATPITVSIYGEVPQGTYAAGSYADQITVTLTY